MYCICMALVEEIYGRPDACSSSHPFYSLFAYVYVSNETKPDVIGISFSPEVMFIHWYLLLRNMSTEQYNNNVALMSASVFRKKRREKNEFDEIIKFVALISHTFSLMFRWKRFWINIIRMEMPNGNWLNFISIWFVNEKKISFDKKREN